MLEYPPTPPPPLGSPVADRPTRQPPRVGSTNPPPPPYNPQNSCTPLGVTHWLVAAPVASCCSRSPKTSTKSFLSPALLLPYANELCQV